MLILKSVVIGKFDIDHRLVFNGCLQEILDINLHNPRYFNEGLQ